MKNEDILIISLTIVVLLVGAVALLVTDIINFSDESPVMGSTPTLNNTTNLASNVTDSLTRDTGVSASEASNPGVSYSFDNSYPSDNSYISSSTSDGTYYNDNEGSETSADSSSDNSESGQSSINSGTSI